MSCLRLRHPAGRFPAAKTHSPRHLTPTSSRSLPPGYLPETRTPATPRLCLRCRQHWVAWPGRPRGTASKRGRASANGWHLWKPKSKRWDGQPTGHCLHRPRRAACVLPRLPPGGSRPGLGRVPASNPGTVRAALTGARATSPTAALRRARGRHTGAALPHPHALTPPHAFLWRRPVSWTRSLPTFICPCGRGGWPPNSPGTSQRSGTTPTPAGSLCVRIRRRPGRRSPAGAGLRHQGRQHIGGQEALPDLLDTTDGRIWPPHVESDDDFGPPEYVDFEPQDFNLGP